MRSGIPWLNLWIFYCIKVISYIISYHIISYHIISYHIISYHIISYHIISYHIIYHIISYHIISYHIISYHIISYYILYYILPLYYKPILFHLHVDTNNKLTVLILLFSFSVIFEYQDKISLVYIPFSLRSTEIYFCINFY